MIQENIGFQIAYFLAKLKGNYNGRALALYLSFKFSAIRVSSQYENKNGKLFKASVTAERCRIS
jgi:hypothetical protein